MTHEEMMGYVEERLPFHHHGRIYRNYEGGLDFHVMFAGSRSTFVYELTMPLRAMDVSADITDEEPYPYPQPDQWHLCIGRILKRIYAPEDYPGFGVAVDTDYEVAAARAAMSSRWRKCTFIWIAQTRSSFACSETTPFRKEQ